MCAADRLRELARRELRDPRDQAAYLIVEGLRRAGLPVSDETKTVRRGGAETKTAARP